ncbi:MAG: zinc-ribbon domain containing protein [Clostridia bacterium]|nr:zinc-ribbon domain containing protein [Clostridia bacterium]
MAFEDKTLVCKDCGQEFVFTSGEQQFYVDHGFQNEPSRCNDCRRARRSNAGSMGGPREMHEIICSSCGKPAQVPFLPSGDRPVYCSECFAASRSEGRR